MTQSVDARLRDILESISREETIALAQRLVRIPSITGKEGLEISTVMADWLREAGIDSGLQVVGEGRANVHGAIVGGPGPRVLLNGHLDTKPGDSMTIDPYSGEIVDGRMYGRGSCDMKGPVAALMIAMKAIAASGVKLNGTLIFGSEVGEDGGGWKIGELLDGPGACDVGICAEPTKMQVHVGCRGTLPLRVRVLGKATHTGTAYKGVNAILKMCKVIPTVYALPCFQRVDPLWERSPVNAMIISGGGKVTASVPDECTVQFDIRLNPDLPPEEARSAIEGLFEQLRADDPELRIESEIGWTERSNMRRAIPARHLPPSDPLVGTVVAAIEEATGERPPLAGFPGGCSTGVMIERGIKSVVFGPGDLEQAHTVDEWVDVEQLYQAAKAYVAIAYRLLK